MNKGKLSFVGLGLFDEKDTTLKGLDEIKKCDFIFAELYTSRLIGADLNKIRKIFGRSIEILSREETEKADKILDAAKNNHVVFLVCGDPMMATTHLDLRIRAIKKNIQTDIVHNASIITAAPGLLGLQNYKFGRTTTLAYPEKDYFPTSPYDFIKENKEMGLHTLVLLDIQSKKDKYMTANEGLELLLEMEDKMKQNIIKEDSVACVVSQAGSPKPSLNSDTIKNLIKKDFGKPLHTIVIPGKLHFMEIEALEICANLPNSLSKKLQKL